MRKAPYQGRCEEGQAIIQFIVTALFLTFLLFGTIQVGGLLLSMNRLSMELSRASWEVDAGGLLLAADKDDFMAHQIIGNSSELLRENLRVSNTRALPETATQQGLTGPDALPVELSRITEEVDTVTVTCDISYTVPDLINFPGLTGRCLVRRIEFCKPVQTVVEVS